jgi:putative spermidine/putrescine transport system substrate-binding protein
MKKSRLPFLAVAAAMVLAACAPPPAAPAPAAPAAPAAEAKPTEAPKAAAEAVSPEMAALIEAAKKEGELTTIALPHDWCNYGAMIEGFKAKYGIKVNELNPDAGSGEELEAVKANKDNKGPQAPDVLDVGPAFAIQAVEEDLVLPYKVSTWNSIPDNLKDKDGKWTGNYYGVMSMQVNADVVKNVPQDFADLLKPEYKGMVSLRDPRTGNSQAQAVFNAALATGGSADDTIKGLEFFAKLNEMGNFVPSWSNQTFGKGETPIVFDWDYNALAQRDKNKDSVKIEVVIPKGAQLGGHYATAISKYAPHPNAAKLWMEYTFSDEGSLHWISGYCHPARYTDLVAHKVIPADLAAKLPSDELYAKAVFPTIDQLNKHKAQIKDNWAAVTKVDEFRKLE